MFKKLFGSKATDQPATPPAHQERKLLLLPESEAEWVPVRAADILQGESLLIEAALMPRYDRELQQARIDRKRPGEGTDGQVELEDMGGGGFERRLFTPETSVPPATIAALPSEPFPVLLYPLYDGRADSEEGLVAMRLQGGTVVGLLPPDDYSLFNNLFLNLEFRTGVYAVCNALVKDGGVEIDLVRYEVCYNRCQRLLHERQAGAKYTEA